MQETHKNDDNPVLTNIHKILEWLKSGREEPKERYFDTLRYHLQTINESGLPQTQVMKLTELIYNHANRMVERLLPSLRRTTLPISRRTRALVISSQMLLEDLTNDYLDMFETKAFSKHSEIEHFSPFTALYCAAHCLSRNLLVSYLAAKPARVGIWEQYHQLFHQARETGAENYRVSPESPQISRMYLRSLLLSCFQPASFSAPELMFLADYIADHDEEVKFLQIMPLDKRGSFWVNPLEDQPAQLLIHSTPKMGTNALYFKCDSITKIAAEHVKRLLAGTEAQQLNLPDFVSRAAGLGVLRRIANFVDSTSKRSFQRRRYSKRATLCPGVENLWLMLISNDHSPRGSSQWMMTNESPNGCAIMHLSGETKHLRVGDIVTFCIDDEKQWQICLVRWAISESSEHIELGLQIMAPSASAAELAVPRLISEERKARLPVLILPELPPVRTNRNLIIQADKVSLDDKNLVLAHQDSGSFSLQDIVLKEQLEQTGHIEIFSFETSHSPDSSTIKQAVTRLEK